MQNEKTIYINPNGLIALGLGGLKHGQVVLLSRDPQKAPKRLKLSWRHAEYPMAPDGDGDNR